MIDGYEFYKCDVLIIGAGAAGLRAAIEAHDNEADVLIVGKSKRGDAHTVLATGGINAALAATDPKDNWLIHAADTLKEGQFLADYMFVEALCRNAPDAVTELVGWGARFAKDKKGRLIQRFFGAHTYRRTCFFGDQTGKEMMRVLIKHVEERKIKALDEIFILKLIVDNGKAKGAVGIDIKKGNLIVISCKAVILASGGYSRIYSVSSSRSYENLGDGIALAYDAGCELMDMEMVQFHPTGMVWPGNMAGTLVTEAVRGEGGLLFNKNDERFMEKYDPKRKELSARDVVARAIYNEIKNGRGTKHDGVWLDISFKPAKFIRKRLPRIYKQFKSVGVDITRQRMEVAPTAHYTMGGIRTDLNGETKIKGLFAAGEVTGDLHGANRLGGNSLAETIVFGKITGKAVCAYKNKIPAKIKLEDVDSIISVINGLLELKGKLRPGDIKEEILELMWKYVGIIRNKKDMETGIRGIMEFKNKLNNARIKTMQDLTDYFDARNIILTAEIVTRSALIRKESRGAHYRNDYTKQSDKWLKHIIFRDGDGKMRIYFKKTAKVKGRLAKAIGRLQAEHHLLE